LPFAAIIFSNFPSVMDTALNPPLRIQPNKSGFISSHGAAKRISAVLDNLHHRGDPAVITQLQKLLAALLEDNT
jgi:hypothetical protein